MIKRIIVYLISLYQKTLSPDYGWLHVYYPAGYCKYSPTCSQYCKESVLKYGVVSGLIRGGWRILRCNPWSKGGHDPV